MRLDHSIQSMTTYTIYYKTKSHLWSVIQFLNAEGVKPAEICTRMLAKYSTSCVSNTQVYEWVQMFQNGVQIVEDPARPEQPYHVLMPKMIAAVDLIRENRHITISEIAMEMKISVGSAHSIAAEEEHYRKVCAWWIPKF